MAKLSEVQKAKILKMIESELEGSTVKIKKQPLKYLAEGKPKSSLISRVKGKPIIVKGGVLHNTDGAKNYRKYTKIIGVNPSYKAFKGKAPFGKVQIKSMLWNKLKYIESPVARAKIFFEYVDEQGGFKTFEDFVYMMAIQTKFLKGCSNKTSSKGLDDISDTVQNKFNKDMRLLKDKISKKKAPKKAKKTDVSKKKTPKKARKTDVSMDEEERPKKARKTDVSMEGEERPKKAPKKARKTDVSESETLSGNRNPFDDSASATAGKLKVIDEIPREVIDRVLSRLRG